MFRKCVAILGLAFLLAGCSVGSPERAAQSRVLKQDQRDRVWIYLLNSPLDRPRLGHLDQSASYLRKAGYQNAKFVSWADTEEIAAEIRNIHVLNPVARIMLIGWSGASLWAWDIADHLKPQAVDTVIYLDSDWLTNRLKEREHPKNMNRIILMYRRDHTPPKIPGALTLDIPTSSHLAVAAHQETLSAILNECDRLAR